MGPFENPHPYQAWIDKLTSYIGGVWMLCDHNKFWTALRLMLQLVQNSSSSYVCLQFLLASLSHPGGYFFSGFGFKIAGAALQRWSQACTSDWWLKGGPFGWALSQSFCSNHRFCSSGTVWLWDEAPATTTGWGCKLWGVGSGRESNIGFACEFGWWLVRWNGSCCGGGFQEGDD